MLKRLILVGILCILLCGAVGGALLWSARRVPDFYEAALLETAPPAARQVAAEDVVQRTVRVLDDTNAARSWSEEFAEEEINHWLAVEVDATQPEWLPPGIREPRVHIGEDALQLAFRVERETVRGVIHCELEPRMSGPNEFAILIRFLRMGLFPLPVSSLFDRTSGHFFHDGWWIRWSRTARDDSIMVQIEKEEPNHPILERLRIHAGRLRVQGTRGSSNLPLARRRTSVHS